MIEDEKIIEMFFGRSEQGIRELDIKYGKVCHNLSYHIRAGNEYRWKRHDSLTVRGNKGVGNKGTVDGHMEM